jgi:hypothetical protein
MAEAAQGSMYAQVQGQVMNPMRTFVEMGQGMHESIAIR